MFKSLTREITLSIQARNGMSPAVVVWTAVIAFASLTAFVFLCVAGYAWLSLRFDSVIAGLIMAGIFVVVALIAALIVGAHPPARQGARHSRTRGEGAFAVMAARSENSRHRGGSRPHHRLATDRPGRPRRFHGSAMGARAPRTQ